jgi:hypothetical protein
MKRVRWKIDLVILPMFLITQALQFMDKTSLNYANLFGYQKALGLKGQQFGFLSASKLPFYTHQFCRCCCTAFEEHLGCLKLSSIR